MKTFSQIMNMKIQDLRRSAARLQLEIAKIEFEYLKEACDEAGEPSATLTAQHDKTKELVERFRIIYNDVRKHN